MINRRAMLRGAAAALLAAPATAATPSPSAAGLKTLAKAKGILFGTAAANYQRDDATFMAALARESGILVAEYESKRDLIEPEQGQFDFSATDLLWAYAQSNAMAFRFHPLVWYAANPPWLENAVLSTKKASLHTGYVERVMRRYRGKLHSVDVVNEAIYPEDGRSDGLRNCFWLKAYGPNYIDDAFHAARAADPAAMLVYNDWGCEAGEPANDRFRALTLKFLDGLIKRGVPLDAYGMQGHLDAVAHQVDQKKLASFLGELQARGLKILVTELDVVDSAGTADIALRDKAVADACRRFLDVMLDNRATGAVVTWGLSDRFLRPQSVSEKLIRGLPRRLPLDSDMRRKPMWNALAASFSARRV